MISKRVVGKEGPSPHKAETHKKDRRVRDGRTGIRARHEDGGQEQRVRGGASVSKEIVIEF